jgi:hypothetical protein
MKRYDRERYQHEGRMRARTGKSYSSSAAQSAFSSYEAQRERGRGFRDEKLMIEREKERRSRG